MDIPLSYLADTTEDLIKYLSLVIELAHYTLVIYGVRSEWDISKAKKQPIGTWLLSLACCFGGGMLINIAVGKPALAPLGNTKSIAMMSMVWWLVFYSPGDIYYQLLSWKPAMVVVAVLKELIRTKKIRKGVMIGLSTGFSDSILVCAILGMMGACGGGFVKNSATFIRKGWNAESIKEVYFAPITKICLLFSLLYTLSMMEIIFLDVNKIVLAQVIVLSTFSVLSKLGINKNPFYPIEKFITSCAVDYSLFGGEEEQEEQEPVPNKTKDSHKKKD